MRTRLDGVLVGLGSLLVQAVLVRFQLLLPFPDQRHRAKYDNHKKINGKTIFNKRLRLLTDQTSMIGLWLEVLLLLCCL